MWQEFRLVNVSALMKLRHKDLCKSEASLGDIFQDNFEKRKFIKKKGRKHRKEVLYYLNDTETFHMRSISDHGSL